MKKITTSLLLLILLLVACSSNSTTPEMDATESPSIESTASENNDQVETSREAVLSEIENDVTA